MDAKVIRAENFVTHGLTVAKACKKAGISVAKYYQNKKRQASYAFHDAQEKQKAAEGIYTQEQMNEAVAGAAERIITDDDAIDNLAAEILNTNLSSLTKVRVMRAIYGY